MTIPGYTLIEQQTIRELRSEGFVFFHEKSGARIFYLSNPADDNKVFSIAFRTPPEDDAGTPHILEHSVLCGSRKFPLKDPFIELAKGSLNTFLNAMTFPDKTMYPIASRNGRDFMNLVDVYLDAVFYPNIYQEPKIMKQEGWHYELASEDEAITYKGVVYNEMKGAFSSPEQILYRKVQQALFPNTPYGAESGGDPDFIPDLTQEKFLSFHSKYYHPSNSYIYFYGDGDMIEHLTWLDQEYLQHFERCTVESAIPEQPPFPQMLDVVEYYPLSANEKDFQKTYLSYNLVLGKVTDPMLYYTLDMLEYMLLEAQGAPLKKALLDAKVGKDVFGYTDNSILQPMFGIVAKNAESSQKKHFVAVIEDTLKSLVQEGIPRRLVEGALNRFEFKLREGDYGTTPTGLIYGISCMDSWLHGESPMLLLQYDSVFKTIRSRAAEGYFEEFIQRYLLGNPHGAIVTLAPQKGLSSRREEETRQKLEAYKRSLSEQEIQSLIQETKDLEEYQTSAESRDALESVPQLSIEDIEPKQETFQTDEDSLCGRPFLWYHDFTNQIAYVKFYFDMSRIPEELLPYVGLLTAVLGSVSTDQYSYEELNNEINIHTGGIGESLSIIEPVKNEDAYQPYFKVIAKCFYHELMPMIELVEEILLRSHLKDRERLEEILSETCSRMEMYMMDSGNAVASARAMSYFAPTYAFQEKTQGVDYFFFLKELEGNLENRFDDLCANLELVCQMLFRRDNITFMAACEEEADEAVRDCMGHLVKNLPEGRLKTELSEPLFVRPVKKNEGLMTSGKVQFVAKAGRFHQEFSGAMLVLRNLLSLDYLWNKVRVLGGAYGCMDAIYRSGRIYFVSYRDPNLTSTLSVFDRAADYVETFDCNQREMDKYIIGTISRLDVPLNAAMKAEAAFERRLSGLTDVMLQTLRDEVLAVTPADIRRTAGAIREAMKENCICVQGGESVLEKNKELFGQLLQLL